LLVWDWGSDDTAASRILTFLHASQTKAFFNLGLGFENRYRRLPRAALVWPF
jgi:hypothetical protein